MKNPEQLANEVLNSIPVGQYSTTAQMIVAAIEADRAQRGLTLSDPDVQADLRQIRDRSGDWKWVLEDLLRPNEGEE